MASKNAEMQAIFSELSEQNKDIVMLVAKSVKVAQEVAAQPRRPPGQNDQPGWSTRETCSPGH